MAGSPQKVGQEWRKPTDWDAVPSGRATGQDSIAATTFRRPPRQVAPLSSVLHSLSTTTTKSLKHTSTKRRNADFLEGLEGGTGAEERETERERERGGGGVGGWGSS